MLMMGSIKSSMKSSVTMAVMMAVTMAPLALAQGTVSYTAGQSTQGKAAYAQACESCHGKNLDDGEFAPPLKGAPFLQKWGGKTADNIFTYMSTKMPPGGSNGVAAETYAQILAFVLESNNVPAGTLALPTDVAALKMLNVPGGGPPAGPSGGLSRAWVCRRLR